VIPPESFSKAIGMLDYHLQSPHLVQYNLTVERQLPANMVMTVSYAGSRGINIYMDREGNPTAPTKVNGQDFWTGTESRINPNWANMEVKSAASSSFYNSLQFGVQKRFSHGLQFQSSYTWSKLLDTTQGISGGESGGARIIGLNPGNINYDKGSADFDFRQSWSFNTLYQLPSLGVSGLAPLLDGWRLGTILRVTTGQHFTPLLSGNRSRSQVEGGGAKDRPNLVSGRGDDLVLGGPNRYFDPTAFEIQPLGFLGNSSRNMIEGPGLINFDLSLTKEFALPWLGEGRHLEFRSEFFNLFNRANFFIPDAGRTVFTADQTRANTTPLATAGQIDRTQTPARQIQFALKFIF
jgi:hypothetical protein